jgi:hypothetical protein
LGQELLDSDVCSKITRFDLDISIIFKWNCHCGGWKVKIEGSCARLEEGEGLQID